MYTLVIIDPSRTGKNKVIKVLPISGTEFRLEVIRRVDEWLGIIISIKDIKPKYRPDNWWSIKYVPHLFVTGAMHDTPLFGNIYQDVENYHKQIKINNYINKI